MVWRKGWNRLKIKTDFLSLVETRTLFDAFHSKGFQIYFVGGCVRNAVLGVPVHDLDLATDATPSDMRDLAKTHQFKIVPTGEDHGTMTFVLGEHIFEVTTFRDDIETDGRRAKVSFSKSMHDDAQRRDFTMNALYLDAKGNVFDPISGLQDAQDRRVVFIGDPEKRIKEDYLRILRFLRFIAQYSDSMDTIDPNSFAACAEHQDGLAHVSKERLTQEIVKILVAPNAVRSISAMAAAGILGRILPGSDPKYLPILIELQSNVSATFHARLAALGALDWQKWLRLSNSDSKRTQVILGAAQDGFSPFKMGYILGQADGKQAYHLRCAFLERFANVDDCALIDEGAKAIFPLRAADLMDYVQGPALGAALKTAKDAWMEHNGILTKDKLIDLALTHG